MLVCPGESSARQNNVDFAMRRSFLQAFCAAGLKKSG